jgi:hypothetical protein
VVIATNPTAPHVQQGSDPLYAAAFMTAALGRLPTLQAGAWVWNGVQAGLPPPLRLKADALGTCVLAAETQGGREHASMRAPACVDSRASALIRG